MEKKELSVYAGRLKQILEQIDELNIVVTQVDPDALASTGLMIKCAAAFEVESRVYYCGSIDGQQNNAIWNFMNMDNYAASIDEYEGGPTALLDSSQIQDSRMKNAHDELMAIDSEDLVIVIDHHPGTDIEETDDNLVIVDTESGASATIVAELAFELGIEFDEKDKLATAGAIGIINDTKTFLRGNDADIRMFGVLLSRGSRDDYAKILNYELPRDYLLTIKDAIDHWKIKDTDLIASVGWLKPGEHDKLFEVADLLIRIKGITLALVWGLEELPDGNFRAFFKARSNDLSLNLNTYVKEKFLTAGGKGQGGIGEAGGYINVTRQEGHPDELTRELAFGDAERMVKYYVFRNEKMSAPSDDE